MQQLTSAVSPLTLLLSTSLLVLLTSALELNDEECAVLISRYLYATVRGKIEREEREYFILRSPALLALSLFLTAPILARGTSDA